MLSQKDRRKIRSKLENIYKPSISKKDIDRFDNEIIDIIKKFNKKNLKKKKIISEKTAVVISYGDSLYSNKKKLLIKNFQKFYQKKIK